jgi:predicted RNA-binding protein
MCEFTVKLGDKVIADEILAFRYTPEGREAAVADILGRSTPLKNVMVTGVTMLPGSHEMTLIQSAPVGKAVELLLALATKNAPGFNRERAQELLDEFNDLVQKELP